MGPVSDGKFRKTDHIIKTGDFRLVYRRGRSVKSGPFVLCYVGNKIGRSRIGFSISSRAVKLATRRNRIRRLFREAYRRNSARLKSANDLVLVVKRAPENGINYKDAERHFIELARAAGLLNA